jgi:CheY-like chemotaxis protein
MIEKPFALIVEDNQDIVTLFQHVLDMAGYHTEIVMDGIEAMERISRSHPDIVLLDLQLPGMTGVEILKQMRTDEALASIPVVVVTAFSNYSARLPYEPDLLLLKPVNIYQLSTLVQRLQATRGAERVLIHDPITGLYTMTAFTEKLENAIEQVKQSGLLRFGVLFAEILKLTEARGRIPPSQFNPFMRKLADQFKSSLRPTDIKAWSPDLGCFLALIEATPIPERAVRIAERVQEGLNQYLETHYEVLSSRSRLGVLMCDAEYGDVKKILEDLSIARSLLREGRHPSPAVFDHRVILTHK